MKAPLEKEILAQCRDYLRLTGWMVLRVNGGAVTGEYKGRRRFVRFTDTPGVSDLLALRDNVFLAIETKRQGREPTAEQSAFLMDVRLHGGVGLVVHSLDELQRELEARGL